METKTSKGQTSPPRPPTLTPASFSASSDTRFSSWHMLGSLFATCDALRPTQCRVMVKTKNVLFITWVLCNIELCNNSWLSGFAWVGQHNALFQVCDVMCAALGFFYTRRCPFTENARCSLGVFWGFGFPPLGVGRGRKTALGKKIWERKPQQTHLKKIWERKSK